ncbi:EamA family transporter [Actinomadura sp. HBU206391]|uniref:EamA family transporter n=1 Tax=Actinomadura sp. HBU206391 TaxID=2731692 RepID=UPI002905D63B|nr:EamA family transporter [Actinomadura sp. HBU206391]
MGWGALAIVAAAVSYAVAFAYMGSRLVGKGTPTISLSTAQLIADEGATNAATVGYLLPVVSVVLGAIVLDEELDGRVIMGMVVVLVGVGMTRLRKRRPAPPTAEDAPVGAPREAGRGATSGFGGPCRTRTRPNTGTAEGPSA